MAGFPSAGTKRKEMEELPDLPLPSPAWKMLRLDVDMRPIMEEETAVPMVFGQQLPKEQVNTSLTHAEFPMTEAIHADESLNDRALVLYDPVTSGPNLPLKVDSDLIAALKSWAFWPGNPNPVIMQNGPTDDISSPLSNCLAIVQWVPSPTSTTHRVKSFEERHSQLEVPMEDEAGSEFALMEIEEEREPAIAKEIGTEVLQQWQQHCETTERVPNISTPVMWSW